MASKEWCRVTEGTVTEARVTEDGAVNGSVHTE